MTIVNYFKPKSLPFANKRLIIHKNVFPSTDRHSNLPARQSCQRKPQLSNKQFMEALIMTRGITIPQPLCPPSCLQWAPPKSRQQLVFTYESRRMPRGNKKRSRARATCTEPLIVGTWPPKAQRQRAASNAGRSPCFRGLAIGLR